MWIMGTAMMSVSHLTFHPSRMQDPYPSQLQHIPQPIQRVPRSIITLDDKPPPESPLIDLPRSKVFTVRCNHAHSINTVEQRVLCSVQHDSTPSLHIMQ